MASPGRGPTDPQRRERIVDAVAGLIVEVGVRGVTHRKAAAAAGVPLAATTYYFSSLDEMIEEAFAKSVAADIAEVRAAIGAIPAGVDLSSALAEIVHRHASDRSGAIMASELGVYSFRSDRGSRLTAEWIGAWTAALADRLDPLAAQMAVLLASVLIQTSAASRESLTMAHVEALLRRGIEGAQL